MFSMYVSNYSLNLLTKLLFGNLEEKLSGVCSTKRTHMIQCVPTLDKNIGI